MHGIEELQLGLEWKNCDGRGITMIRKSNRMGTIEFLIGTAVVMLCAVIGLLGLGGAFAVAEAGYVLVRRWMGVY